jgi:hypothetical protein
MKMTSTTRTIYLKQDTELWSTYAGRGLPSRSILMLAGTPVLYNRQVTKAGIYHTVFVNKDGRRYEAVKKEEVK